MKTLLKATGLRSTACRREVLQHFIDQSYALSHSDLERNFASAYDRVTLYRTLSTFVERGLLHKIPDDSGSARYALCREHCDEHAHHDNHAHFKCRVCGKAECLAEIHIPPLTLPPGYQAESTNLLMEGVCRTCSAAQVA